ncbi:MAG: dihydroneopterin aldolase [Rikenellaceae bacterium]
MITTIELENMQFRAYHGCYDLEKQVGNNFQVDLKIDAEIGEAAQRDEVAQTLNYLEVYDLVCAQMKITSNIVENVALRIVDALYEKFPQIKKVTIKVSKLAPPLGGKVEKVSVTLTR